MKSRIQARPSVTRPSPLSTTLSQSSAATKNAAPALMKALQAQDLANLFYIPGPFAQAVYSLHVELLPTPAGKLLLNLQNPDPVSPPQTHFMKWFPKLAVKLKKKKKIHVFQAHDSDSSGMQPGKVYFQRAQRFWGMYSPYYNSPPSPPVDYNFLSSPCQEHQPTHRTTAAERH